MRRKYQLYAESSDFETNNDTLKANDYSLQNGNRRYQDFSLPCNRKINEPDSAKLHDLVIKHRRASSDTSKDKQAGAYVHVKGKRKAPLPPLNLRTLSPKSSLGRKKRPAPKPPAISRNFEEASASSTSLLEDKEIKAIIEGTSRKLSQNFSAPSSSSIPIEMERKTYVSPYLKIREDRKLTDEQKRILIDQVSKNHRKRDERSSMESNQSQKRSSQDIFTIEKGQLVYQGNESPKLPHKEEKIVVAPSSPISPRPWFKRPSNQKETLEKRKSKNDDKDLPEFGYARNSFFGSASRFNIFARLGDDSKKKERDSEKRKSQIGMPNISELDREAAEIIQRVHEMNETTRKSSASEMLMRSHMSSNMKDPESDDRPRTTKDLISKFEADTSHMNRITLNPAFVARKEFFGESYSSSPKTPDSERKHKSKLPQLIKETNGIRKQNDLMGLWTCPYCTLENPNWKIICEACEKIKPYEKRFCVNGDLVRETNKKTEAVLKYFNPPAPSALSKSSSETTVVKSLKRKSPSRIAGSPLMNLRRNILKAHSEQEPTKINVIEEENVEKDEMKLRKFEDSVIVKTKPVIYSTPKESKAEKSLILEKTPNLSEVRSARLAKFNLLSSNIKKDEEFSHNSNQKQSPEKKFVDKLDFSNPVALELEKERLREKIRAMNAKALAEKYPVLPRILEKNVEAPPEPTAPQISPTDQSKLGAIRKIFKSPAEPRRESFNKPKSEDKILNGGRETSREKSEKRESSNEKVSISVQTVTDVKRSSRKVEDLTLIPATVNELQKPEVANQESELTSAQKVEVEEISDQLKSQDGIESFKATLKSKSINMRNTLAINKILRFLEIAISEGKYDEAAQLATDLAKMKVSLSVTRQKDRPKSGVDIR